MKTRLHEHEQLIQTITRKQLQAYGVSNYQARVVTQNLTPVGKQGQAYLYDLRAVVTSIGQYIQRPRIKESTRNSLDFVLDALLKRLGNVVEVPFAEGGDPQLRKLGIKLLQARAKTDASLAMLKADAAEIKAKYCRVR